MQTFGKSGQFKDEELFDKWGQFGKRGHFWKVETFWKIRKNFKSNDVFER